MDKKILSAGAFFGMTAIILGAFGAHALKKVLSFEQLSVFDVGIKYQMYHALFLLFLGINHHLNSKIKKIVSALTILGVIFFSGSIYLLSTMSISNIDFKVIGIITPIGGALLISAWAVVLFQFLSKKS